MKRYLALLLAVSLLMLPACTTNNQDGKSSGSEQPVVSVDGSTLTLGNFEIQIPDGFSVNSSDENTVSIASADGGCFIGVFAADVSGLTEEQVKTFLPQQAASFMADSSSRASERQSDTRFGPFDVTIDLYAETSSELAATVNMDTSFTDSWYTYTIMFRCYADSDKLSDYTTTFAEFCGYAEYTGEDARFDFVQ